MISPELELAEKLLTCLQNSFAGHPSVPARICLRVGEEVRQDLSMYEDECCDGLAYVKINNLYPSRRFPEPDESAAECAFDQWAVDLEMGVLRCSPVGDLKHVATCGEWEAAATNVALDAVAMRRAISCLRGQLEPGDLLLPRQWQPIGPQGNCTGGTHVVTVSFADPC